MSSDNAGSDSAVPGLPPCPRMLACRALGAGHSGILLRSALHHDFCTATRRFAWQQGCIPQVRANTGPVPFRQERYRLNDQLVEVLINGRRGTIDSIEKLRHRVECDIHYLENWSLMFDLEIIALTTFKGFVAREAC
jgi:Bacterial sugar transferase